MRVVEQFERAWENAVEVSGLNHEWINMLGEANAKDMAQHWWLKGFGCADGSLYWPDPATYRDDEHGR